jgi:hypothetical protein
MTTGAPGIGLLAADDNIEPVKSASHPLDETRPLLTFARSPDRSSVTPQCRSKSFNSRIVGHSEAMMELLASGGGSPAPMSLPVAVPNRRCGKASEVGTG